MSRQRLQSISGGYESPTEDSPLSANPKRPASRRNLVHEKAVDQTVTSLSELGDLTDEDAQRPKRKVSIRDQICCLQWTWFTMVCSTPSLIANMVANTLQHGRRW